MEQHLTADQLAKLLGVHTETIRRKTRAGFIPCLRHAGTIRYSWPAVQAALSNSQEGRV